MATQTTLKKAVMLLAMLICFSSLLTVQARERRKLSSSSSDQDEDNEQPSEKADTVIRPFLDPRGTWLALMRNSDRTRSMKRPRTRSGRRNRISGVAGPPGPPGPPGPQGPPGAVVTKEVLLEEFKDLVREAAERRMQEVVDPECTDCPKDKLTPTVSVPGRFVPPLFDIQEAAILTRISTGFHCQLTSTKVIGKRTMLELQSFHVPFANGSFHRGEGLQLKEGRFQAPRNGIYHLTANLLVWQKGNSQNKQTSKSSKGTVRLLICINSLCHQNIALEAITTFHGYDDQHSLSVNGHLELKKGQYVSVYVDNNSNTAIKVGSNSFFTGILSGI